MLETGVGRAASAALSRTVGRTAADLSPPADYLETDIVEPEPTVVGGAITVPDRPGLGFEVRHDVLEDATVARRSFGAF
jgi:L-alanine-DL-glutamate epimerase-like enolase superfamily enzyme